MPTRLLLRLFLLSGLMAPLCAFALGVGQIEVRSALNQTFEAELPLITSNPAELTGLTVRIPRQEEFNRVGVERLELFSKLRFAVQNPPDGRSVVKITSIEPIREPNFNLLLELVWARGRLIREFAIQLDPELYANRRPPPPLPPPPVVAPPVVAPPVAAAPAVPQLPPAPPVSFEGATFYGPVKPGETLAAIANRVRPSTATNLPEMMAILVAGNPAAFVSGNPNTLRAGATLKVPTPQALGVSAPPASPPLLAVAPVTPEPTAAPAPELATPPSPPSLPLAAEPPSVTVPASSESSTVLPPSAATPPVVSPATEGVQPPVAPVPALGPVPPSQMESPQEIIPQATIPQPEPSPAGQAQPGPGAQPEPSPASQTQPGPGAQPEPSPTGQAQPAPKAAPPPVVESSWLDNPVVWVAIILIALAIAAVILLPLLRRPKVKPTDAAMAESPESGESTAVVEPQETPMMRTRIREPGSIRPRPAAGGAGVAPAPAAAKSAAGLGSAPPKPIGELLKDLDLGLAQGEMPVAARPGAAPVPDIKAPLLEAEPPTAPVARQSINQFETTPPEPAAQDKKAQEAREAPPQLSSELPSELRLDGFDFDLDGLAGKTARPQPAELPPLELNIAEPPPKSSASSAAPVSAVSPAPTMKFEFTDVTQELPKHRVEDLKLDETLQTLGGDTLQLSSQQDSSGKRGGGTDTAEFVETKLDLAAAYLDMGDQVGARSLLEEVLREGDAAQKERAGAFLKKLN